MQIKETSPLNMKDQRIFRGLDWNPNWFKPQHVNTDPLTPVPFAIQRLLKRNAIPGGEREFLRNTYEFVRLSSRASFDLKRTWGTWYLVWYNYFFFKCHKKPRVCDMLEFRNKFLQIVEDWLSKKKEDLFWCSCCKSYKPRSHFYKDKSRVNGVSSKCKPCTAAYRRSKRSGCPIELRKEDRGFQYQGLGKQLREASRVLKRAKNVDRNLGEEVYYYSVLTALILKAPDVLYQGLTVGNYRLVDNPIEEEDVCNFMEDYEEEVKDFLDDYKKQFVCYGMMGFMGKPGVMA